MLLAAQQQPAALTTCDGQLLLHISTKMLNTGGKD